MDNAQRRTAIAQHLTNASAAHADYEQTVLEGEYDEQWAEWYADYLVEHGWNELFTDAWNAGALAEALKQAHQAHRAEAPGAHWPDFYSERLVKRI